MRYIPLIAALALIATPAQAQDLQALKGCYAETSVAGTFLASGPREATGGIGGGCDVALGKATLGAGIRADWLDLTSGSLFGKLGIAINPHASVYALAVWSVPDWKLTKAGQLQLGAGAELSLASLVPNTSAFVEATSAVSKFGPLATRDDVIVRLGLRYRF